MWYMFVMYSDHSSRTLANNEKDIEVFEERLKGRQHKKNQCDILCSNFVCNTDGKSVFHRKQRSRRKGILIFTAPEYSAQGLLLFR